MALLKGKLFAGALFAGVLLGGQQVAQTPDVVPVKPSYGGGYFGEQHTPKKHKNRVEVNDRLAMLQAEDEILLQIIMNAVTRNLL